MLPKNVYNDRNTICNQCQFWQRGMCRKGHIVSSPTGCPIRKFPPINGAGYDPDREPEPEETVKEGCCGYSNTMQDLTAAQVAVHFAKAMAKWTKAGMPLVPAGTHGQRQSKCATCPHRKGHWCSLCKCLIYPKTKLATEQCPDNPPKWLHF